MLHSIVIKNKVGQEEYLGMMNSWINKFRLNYSRENLGNDLYDRRQLNYLCKKLKREYTKYVPNRT